MSRGLGDVYKRQVCTPLDAPPLADHLARDKDHYYQNDEMMEEPLWLESLHELIQKP